MRFTSLAQNEADIMYWFEQFMCLIVFGTYISLRVLKHSNLVHSLTNSASSSQFVIQDLIQSLIGRFILFAFQFSGSEL